MPRPAQLYPIHLPPPCMHVRTFRMYACVHVCMCACTYACTPARMHACTRTFACTHTSCTPACTHVRIYACTHVRMYACTHVPYACMHVRVQELEVKAEADKARYLEEMKSYVPPAGTDGGKVCGCMCGCGCASPGAGACVQVCMCLLGVRVCVGCGWSGGLLWYRAVWHTQMVGGMVVAHNSGA